MDMLFINKKQSLKILSYAFVLAFLSSSLHAQQKTTFTRVIDGDTIQALYGGDGKKDQAYRHRYI
jgi:hypothetical protein